MRAKITYVYHNCFILETGGRTMIFDYPDEENRSGAAEDLVINALKGADAYVFFSHSHGDHCSADIMEYADEAGSINYVLSYDVPDMVPDFEVENSIVVEPEGEEYLIGDLSISALESTDLGVAFMIRAPEGLIYYGGDLAEWTWDGIRENELEQEQAYFEECIGEIKKFGPDITFTNLDMRLENYGGGPKLLEMVRPKVFVPMHGFGDAPAIAKAAGKLNARETEIFTYYKEGDSLEVDLRG